MKSVFVADIRSMPPESFVVLPCWLRGRRTHGQIVFLDLVDSTGTIQCVADASRLDKDAFERARHVALESAVCVSGRVVPGGPGGRVEIRASAIEVVGLAVAQFSPQPRADVDIFDESLVRQILDERHIYLRNPKIMAVLRFRHIVLRHIRNWFEENRFTSFEAPILTPVPLYENETAMPIEVAGEKVFLTQCVGFYLEAAVHAFERVYNIGPSFRGEESRSKRHLMEYWHVKAEMAWGDLDDIIASLESMMQYVAERALSEADDILAVLGTVDHHLKFDIPFRRIAYPEAIDYLQKRGFKVEVGQKLRAPEQAELFQGLSAPYWMCGIPSDVEPFPYALDPQDRRITRVADLIMSDGHGELGGVAEKITDLSMLDQRMADKGKGGDPRYQFIRDIHQFGCVPHIAFGIGLERLIRWYLNLDHVRDAIGFPRIFRRRIAP